MPGWRCSTRSGWLGSVRRDSSGGGISARRILEQWGAPPLSRFLRQGGDFDFDSPTTAEHTRNQNPHPDPPKNGAIRVGNPRFPGSQLREKKPAN